jgi:hypothetical protein
MTNKTKLPDPALIPFLDILAEMIADNILREEAEHQKRQHARSASENATNEAAA